jgi:hypothetical protein
VLNPTEVISAKDVFCRYLKNKKRAYCSCNKGINIYIENEQFIKITKQVTQDEEQENKNTTQYVLGITLRKQTQIT